MSRSWWVKPVVTLVLPLATRWVARQERRILSEGRALTGDEKEGARAIGVSDVDAVRVLATSPVPTPGNRLLIGLAKITRCPLTDPPGGMALGYGIYIDSQSGGGFSTVLHELVHVCQYEDLGGIRPFLAQYLWECLALSYWESPMEREAVEVSAEIKNRLS